MKLLPRSWYFYYGRLRLYRRLSTCVKVLALIAGAIGIFYWNRPEMSHLRPLTALQEVKSFSTL